MNHRIDTFTDLKNALKPHIFQIIDDFDGGIWTKGWNVDIKEEFIELNKMSLFQKLNKNKDDEIHKNITINLVDQLKRLLEDKHLDQMKQHPLNYSGFYHIYEVVLVNICLTIIDLLKLPTNLIIDYHEVLRAILSKENEKARCKLKNADQKIINALNENIGQLNQKRITIYQQIWQRYDEIDLEKI